MDDELRQLEAELKRLRPMEPSPRLAARIARELDATAVAMPQSRGSRWWTGWGWAAVPLAAAAALAFALAPSSRRDMEPSLKSVAPVVSRAAGEALKPVAAENVLYSAVDEGLVTLEDGTPARRERLQYVDTITWRNPRTNASLRWTVPREEVRVVPVVFQ